MGMFDFFKGKKKNILNDNGLNEIYYENGQLKEKFTNINGKLNGIKSLFYEDGKLCSESSYRHGLQNGPYKHYYATGQLRYEANFKDDKYNGPYKSYHSNGQLNYEFYLKDDEIDGIHKEYYKNGQLKREANFKDGRKIGTLKAYYENGHLWYEANFRDHKLNGLYRGYYENGQLKIECYLIDNKFNGLFKHYYENGQLDVEAYYKDDEKNELSKEYYKNGELDVEAYSKYYEKNILPKKYFFKNDQLDVDVETNDLKNELEVIQDEYEKYQNDNNSSEKYIPMKKIEIRLNGIGNCSKNVLIFNKSKEEFIELFGEEELDNVEEDENGFYYDDYFETFDGPSAVEYANVFEPENEFVAVQRDVFYVEDELGFDVSEREITSSDGSVEGYYLMYGGAYDCKGKILSESDHSLFNESSQERSCKYDGLDVYRLQEFDLEKELNTNF